MPAEALADAVALAHAALVALIVGGALVATTPRWVPRFPRWVVALYLLAVAGTFLSNALTGDCLLTQWEKTLRNAAAPGGAYGGSFLAHYLPFLLPFLPHGAGFAPLLGCVLALTAWAWLWLRRRGRAASGPPSPPPLDRSP